MIPILKSNADAISGSALGVLSSLSITQMPVDDGGDAVLKVVGYVVSVVVAFGPMLVKKYLVGEAAGDRVRAQKERDKAQKKRDKAQKLHLAGKGDEAIKLEAEADAHDERADELEAQAAEHEARARGGQ